MSLLAVKDLHANVGEEDERQEILKGLNLQIQAGEVHAIMGPNGSGKSTLANVLSGRPGLYSCSTRNSKLGERRTVASRAT